MKAAVRALRGPAGGLGAGEEVVEDEGEGMVREKNGKGKEKDRLGLMKLFEPLEEGECSAGSFLFRFASLTQTH